MMKVYYDGLCHLCSREIDHYRRVPGSDKIQFIDITAPAFNAADEGVDPKKVHAVMHVRTAQGQLATGVNAFIEIWKNLPRYQWAARWAQKPAIFAILNAGYHVFAQIRPWLPRKKDNCSASPYCELPTGEKS